MKSTSAQPFLGISKTRYSLFIINFIGESLREGRRFVNALIEIVFWKPESRESLNIRIEIRSFSLIIAVRNISQFTD